MAKCGIITLTDSTVDTDNFDLLADDDGLGTPNVVFETGISRASLLASGFTSYNIPELATVIRAQSDTAVCTNYADYTIEASPTPTPTPTPSAIPSVPFDMIVDTTKAGSAADTMVIPTYGAGYNFTIDWGDGTIESKSGTAPATSHTYASGGSYNIQISGVFPTIYFNNGGDSLKLIEIQSFGTVGWNSFNRSFMRCSNLTTVGGDADISLVTIMDLMFYDCTSLTSVDASDWDMSSVNSMRYMFFDCTSLTSVDASDWDMSSVTNMQSMFNGCSNLTSLDVSTWNTSEVTNMSAIFRSCSSLTSLDVSGWDTSSAIEMESTFTYCSSLTSLDVSGWDTSLVTTMHSMFNGCSSLTTLDVSGWDTSSAISMWYMFLGCSSLTTLDVSGWDTSSVTNMKSMFSSCSSLTTLDVSGWDTSSANGMTAMFNNCTNLKIDLSSFIMTSVTSTTFMCFGCNINEVGTTTNYDNTLIAWELQNLVNGLSINFGTSKYSSTGENAKENIIIDDSWNITDGGLQI